MVIISDVVVTIIGGATIANLGNIAIMWKVTILHVKCYNSYSCSFDDYNSNHLCVQGEI